MLQTPTNNFGLASLFKNFVLIGEQFQYDQVSKILAIFFTVFPLVLKCAILQDEFRTQLDKSLSELDDM